MRTALRAVAASLLFLSGPGLLAQVSLTTLNTAVTQDFNTLATSGAANAWADNTTLPGWYAQFTLGAATNPTTYRADAGGSNTGAIYSWGTGIATERAFGSVASGTPGTILRAVRFVNNTGATITSLDVSYTGEQWRDGGAATPVAQKIDFQYQVANAGTITDANTPASVWLDHNALDFTSPTFVNTGAGAALDGNALANRTAISATITVTVNAGQEIWLRWQDINDAGNDHGLGVDDFSVTPQGVPPVPTLNINDVTQAEGNAGTTTFTFAVTLSGPAANDVTFDIATANDTATTLDNDYVQRSLTGQTIPAGTTGPYLFSVDVNGDLAIELTETFFVNVTNISANANAGDAQGLGTITNDDSTLPFLSVNDVTLTEGNAGTTTFSFTVSLSAPAPPGGVTFDIATADNTATTANNDYTAKSLTGQTITAGSTGPYTFTVDVTGDTAFEPNETFFVNVTNIVNATPNDTQGQGTITNDDIGLSINNVTAVETNSGTTTFTFTVTLTSAPGAGTVTFDIATADNTATTGNNDYVARTLTTQTITGASTTYTFDVTVNGDTTFEPNESFFVNVTNVTGADLTDAQGLGTITNDDAAPTLSIADVAVTEGNAGTQTMTFTVTLSVASPTTVTVDYATADSSATAGSDYVAVPTTQLTFVPGDTSETFDVVINGDTAAEGNEQFLINLSNASAGAVIGDGQALGIIRMDDPLGIAAVDTPVAENFNSLAQTTAATTPTGWTFAETGSSANFTYDAGTGSSTTGNTYSFGSAAAADRAFGGLQSGALIPTLGAFYRNDTGVTISTLTIAYTGEQWRLGTAGRADRLDFQFSLDATSVTTGTWTDVDTLDFNTPIITVVGSKDGNAAANRTAITATIPGLSIAPGSTFWIRFADFNASGGDDGLAVDDFSIVANITGVLTINDVSVVEGNAGTITAQFTVTRSDPAPAGGTTFDITTSDGSATVLDNDYVASSVTGATIPQGATTFTFNVTVNGDTNQEPTEDFFVTITNVTNAAVVDGQGRGQIAADDFTFTAIHDVQGSGNTSPFAGSTVTVNGIVTGIKQGGSGGFFVQMADAEVDADPNTSEGIFVFTAGSVPAGVAIGNRVAVTGTVSEFPGSAAPHAVTELSGAISVSELATGQPLPAPVTLTPADGAPTTNISQYERFEGMRVTATLTVVAPTEGVTTESTATGSSNGVFYAVIAGVSRPFREAGIPQTDLVPSDAPCAACIPRFDTNPERLRVSSTSQPGATQLNVVAGQTVSNIIGELDFGFFEYSILPEAATVPVVTGPSTFVAVPVPTANELTISSFNLERFFDTVDDPGIGDPVLTPAAFANRLNKASLAIRNVLRSPDVLGVVEVENLSTLQALADKINADAPGTGYVAYLVEGNDIGGIDVGFLVKESRVTTISVTQEGQAATFTNPDTGLQDLLNDRPPLVLMATVQRANGTTYPFTVIVNHLRSLNGAETDDADGRRVRAKRAAQAEFLANLVQARQTANPAERILLVGDFNAFEFSDGLVDGIGTIKGTPTPASNVVRSSPDLVNPDLTNLVETLPADQRYSFLFGGNAQVLDHAIANAAFLPSFTRVAYGRLDADFPEIFRSDATRPERLSDHDGIVAYFDISAAGTLQFSSATYSATESTTTFNVTVTRAGGSDGAVSADYAIAAGTAQGTDFTAATGTVMFASGQTTQTFAVTIANDLIDEPDETVQLTLSNPQGGTTLGAPATATLTIVDDDGAPTLLINDVTVNEGNAGITVATFTVTLAGSTSQTITVNYATADGTATGSDYATAGGTLTFIPGTTTLTFDVNVNGDTTVEADEQFFVNLSGETNATIADAQGSGTITNDDAIAIADLSLTVTRTPPSPTGGQQVTFSVVVTNNGPAAASNVVVTDQIPAGTAFVSATPSQGSCSGTTTVTCSVGTLANGATATVTIVVQLPPAGGTFSNVATAVSAENDPTVATNTNTFTAAAVVSPADIPTMSEWMLMALALALAAFGAMKLRI